MTRLFYWAMFMSLVQLRKRLCVSSSNSLVTHYRWGGGGERRKWSLLVSVNEVFCSDGSNKSQACSHTGVLPHAVPASCFKMLLHFFFPFYCTMHFWVIWANSISNSASFLNRAGARLTKMWEEARKTTRQKEGGICVHHSPAGSPHFEWFVLQRVQFLFSLLSWSATQGPKFHPKNELFWSWLDMTSPVLYQSIVWESRTEALVGMNAEASVDLILSSSLLV